MTNETNLPTIQETDKFTIIQQPDGKFKKMMKYERYFSKVPQTDEETLELYRVFNDQNNGDIVTSMRDMIDKEIVIHEIFTNPYESFNEQTGEITNGVTTTLYDGERYYATSSKSFYHSIMNLMNVFGQPSEDRYKPVRIKVTGTKQQNGVQINFTPLGIEK